MMGLLILWMDEIHFAPLGNHGNPCLLVFSGESSFQGFLGGAKWILSIHSISRFLPKKSPLVVGHGFAALRGTGGAMPNAPFFPFLFLFFFCFSCFGGGVPLKSLKKPITNQRNKETRKLFPFFFHGNSLCFWLSNCWDWQTTRLPSKLGRTIPSYLLRRLERKC